MRFAFLLALMTGLSFPISGQAHAADEPSPTDVLQEAKALSRAGKYEESLQKHLWYHENAVRLEPGQGAVRLSFALSDWAELGQKYPPAKVALVAVRDKDVADLESGKGSFSLFQEIASINDYLKQPDRTIALFRSVQEKDNDLALVCYLIVEKELVARGDYETCSKYIPDPSSRLERFERNVAMEGEMANLPLSTRKHLEKNSIEDACRLIEILVGADRKPEAEKFQAQVLAIRDDPAIRQAVTQAVDRVAAQTRTVTLDAVPPVVVRTVPEAGAEGIDPATTEIRVTFSKPMQDETWSWSTLTPESFPETTGKPRYDNDHRTSVLPVKLAPGKTYAIWVNSQKFHNFKDTKGISAVPFLLVFRTRD